MADLSALHNHAAAEAVSAIVRPMIAVGASDSDIMVVLESAVLGVLLYCERAEGVSRPATIERLDSLTAAVVERLPQGP